LLREALLPLGDKVQVALIFGSFATGTQTAHSDIDLLVVGRVGFAALVKVLHPFQEVLRREINPLLYAPPEFRERVRKGEGILKRVTGQPVLYVVGTKDDLAELGGDPALAGARR
jgi:predicted nucleotidyltransferase